MDLLGHCYVAERSGLLDESGIYGPGIVELMYLNFAHCHDWAYQIQWDQNRPWSAFQKSVHAHRVADWIIHYGVTQKTKRKKGWAYRNMIFGFQMAQPFFNEATKKGLLIRPIADFRKWPKKGKLDFAHSMLEYALEFIFAPKMMDQTRFKSVRKGLMRLADPQGFGSREWAMNVFLRHGVLSDRSTPFIRRSISDYAHDAEMAQVPEDFAVATVLRKFGLCESRESRRLVYGYLAEIADQINFDVVETMVEDMMAPLCHAALFAPMAANS